MGFWGFGVAVGFEVILNRHVNVLFNHETWSQDFAIGHLAGPREHLKSEELVGDESYKEVTLR